MSEPTTAPPTVMATKIPSTVVFGIGLFLFLMPFIDIRCNNMSLQKISGVQLATGFRVEAPRSNNSLMGQVDGLADAADQKPLSEKGGNPYALAAFGLAIVSLALAFTNAKSGITGAVITGVLGGIAMVGLMISINREIGEELKTEQDMIIAVNFTPWFYISLLAAFVGAVFSYRRLKTMASSA